MLFATIQWVETLLSKQAVHQKRWLTGSSITRSRSQSPVHTQTQIHKCARAHACMHARTHARTHPHTHTHTHTHTQASRYIQTGKRKSHIYPFSDFFSFNQSLEVKLWSPWIRGIGKSTEYTSDSETATPVTCVMYTPHWHNMDFVHKSFNNNNNRTERRNSRFSTISSLAANRLRHVRSSGLGAIVCKSHATHRLSRATCDTCHVVQRDSSAIKFDRVEITFI